MTIKGIGNDIIEIKRIKKVIEKHGEHFLSRLFSQKEKDYCNQFKESVAHFAGRFAAKEAIAKALCCGFGKNLSWLDIEILPDKKGKPVVFLSEKANKLFDSPQVLISISHSESYATAVAIWVLK